MHSLKYYIIMIIVAVLFQGCCIHQWPELNAPDENRVVLHLHFDPDMYVWEHTYSSETETVTQSHPDASIFPQHPGTTDVYDNTRIYGMMRHIIRVYPVDDDKNYLKEIVLDSPTRGKYDCDVELNINPGVYNIAVWSDLREFDTDDYFHNANDFFSVNLENGHKGNSDFRDAFSGRLQVYVEEGIEDLGTVEMKRPSGKFEFIATDLHDFLAKEKNKRNTSDLLDYKVVISYPMYMPCSFSVIDDRLVDSRSGVSFTSEMTPINDEEVSLGFDYVMINPVNGQGNAQAVTVMLTVFDSEGNQVANSAPIKVPIRRDNHTVIRSAFLSENADGGVKIDPDYDGDHNIWM